MLRMLSSKIAVIPIEDPDKIGHIIVPEEAKRRSDQGIVKYRGDGVKEIRVGDHVIFSGYTGDRVMTEDEGQLIIMHERDVIALREDTRTNVLYTREQVVNFLQDAFDETPGAAGPDRDTFVAIIERFEAILDSFETVRV